MAAIALGSACDSRATASDPPLTGGALGLRPEQRSREYESCGATMHCQEGLRCFGHTCRRGTRSTVGDFHAAVGAAARARGDVEAAIAAYTQSLGQYGAEKVEVPPEIDCAYGATLAAARAKREHAELGARVLHRCVLAVPTGSELREQALMHLASLAPSGLDPLTLGGSKVADVYLTKAPARPSSDKLTVAVTASPATTSKSYGVVSQRLVDSALRPGMVACWEAYHAAVGKDSLAVTLAIKVAYVPSEFEDEPGAWSVAIEPAPGLTGPEASAEACVRQVVESGLKGQKLVDGLNTKLTITIR